mgnify:CR=1 FL=1
MGWVRKVTGADKQAQLLRENAAKQEEALRAAAKDQTAQLIEQTRMAMEQQRIAQEREAAAGILAKSEAVDTSTVDVAQADPVSTSLATTQKRRAQFKFGGQGVTL